MLSHNCFLGTVETVMISIVTPQKLPIWVRYLALLISNHPQESAHGFILNSNSHMHLGHGPGAEPAPTASQERVCLLC